MKQWMAVAAVLAMAVVPAVAAAPGDTDVSGTWKISGEVSGVGVAETCTLTQADTVVTGSCDAATGKSDAKGKIDGKTLTFVHGGNYEGTAITMTYTGKLGSDGTLTGTIDVDPFAVTGSFSATKADAPAPPAAGVQ